MGATLAGLIGLAMIWVAVNSGGGDGDGTQPEQGVIGYAEPSQSFRMVDIGSGRSTTVDLPADGYPDQPFASGSSFVFMAAGAAWIADPAIASRSPDVLNYRSLGAAAHVFPSDDPNAVWLVRDDRPPNIYVQLVDLTGRPTTKEVYVGADSVVVASVGRKLVLQRSDGTLVVFDPSDNTTAFSLGVSTAVLATHGSLVAWLGGPLRQCAAEGCPLFITDIITGQDRVIDPPSDNHQWIRGGAISPDGATLAAFVDSYPAERASETSGPGAELVIVDVASGDLRFPIANSVVAVGEPVVAASWSSTSNWLFFSGLKDPMVGYRRGATSAVKLSLPSSYTFAVN